MIVLGIEGAGGIVGAILFGLAPDGHLMEMPVEMMHGTFPDFWIPGLVLAAMGFLSCFATVALFKRRRNDWLLSAIALSGWITWFTVEIIIIQELHILHLFWGLPVMIAAIAWPPLLLARSGKNVVTGLLYCGLASSVWYLFINVFVPQFYSGYNMADYTPSELSAFGAPTRILWVLLVMPYPLLFASFGWGLFYSSVSNKMAQTVGVLIIAYCMFNLYWPPMHMREVIAQGGETLSDTLHLVWAGITVMLFVLMMGFGSASWGKLFRLYTFISIALLLIFGLLTSSLAGNLKQGLPTPLIGVWERINIGIFITWVGALSVMLARKKQKEIFNPSSSQPTSSPAPTASAHLRLS